MEREIIELWNQMAQKHGLPKVRVITPLRKTRLKICTKILPDIKEWEIAINEVPKCRFRLGENDRKWKANLDWFIDTRTPFMKLLENAEIEEPEKVIGAKEIEPGVDNETASSAIGDILRGIK